MTDKLTSSDTTQLVLASGSPRRAELLSAAGIAFSVHITDIDESVLAAELPAVYVERLSREKAQAAIAALKTKPPVLAADTTVVIDSEIAGKPTDAADARRMLNALSGRWHEVLTGVTLTCERGCKSEVALTRVKFLEMSTAEIDWYVDTAEPFGKAGAYGIQGSASLFIERIEGSYSNVVGLPIHLVYCLARELGIHLIRTR